MSRIAITNLFPAILLVDTTRLLALQGFSFAGDQILPRGKLHTSRSRGMATPLFCRFRPSSTSPEIRGSKGYLSPTRWTS